MQGASALQQGRNRQKRLLAQVLQSVRESGAYDKLAAQCVATLEGDQALADRLVQLLQDDDAEPGGALDAAWRDGGAMEALPAATRTKLEKAVAEAIWDALNAESFVVDLGVATSTGHQSNE